MDIQIRSVGQHELAALLELYQHLHASDAPLPDGPAIQVVWEEMLRDPRLRCLVVEDGGRLVASCTLVIIPNLTRGARPYGLIENVVTHADYRRRGMATQLLRQALEQAWADGCYKVMLLTGRQDQATLRFYEKAGFRRGVKTGFVATPASPDAGANEA
jgi:ribosomal protein S18 acetylase RimI-like enzyme